MNNDEIIEKAKCLLSSIYAEDKNQQIVNTAGQYIIDAITKNINDVANIEYRNKIQNTILEDAIKKMFTSSMKGIVQFNDVEVTVVDVVGYDYFDIKKRIILRVMLDGKIYSQTYTLTY